MEVSGSGGDCNDLAKCTDAIRQKLHCGDEPVSLRFAHVLTIANTNFLRSEIVMNIFTHRFVAAATFATIAIAALQSVQAHTPNRPTPPDVPASIQVPAGNVPYFIGHAIGTQNYSCLPSATSTTGFAWTLFTPQAVLANRGERQVSTHFFSPNPAESGTIRATWMHSDDSSVVWGKAFPPSNDPAYVAPGALAWLLIEVKGAQEGPHGGDYFTQTTYIHRVNTAGGLAPTTGCATAADVGKSAYVPYLADYVFYREAK